MSAPDLRGAFQFGYDILKTTVSTTTRKILVQLGSVVGQTVDTDNAELVQQYGFFSRMPKPIAGKQAAQAFIVRAGDRDAVIGTQDLRGLELYGEADDSDAGIYSAGEDGQGQARVLCKADGSIHLYTRKGNTPTGAGMTVQLDAENGKITLLNDKGHGIVIDEDGIKLTTGAAALTLGADGAARLVATGPAQVDGTSITLGAAGVPGVNSAIMGPAGIAGVPNPKVILGVA
jgi:hypothetical protein